VWRGRREVRCWSWSWCLGARDSGTVGARGRRRRGASTEMRRLMGSTPTRSSEKILHKPVNVKDPSRRIIQYSHMPCTPRRDFGELARFATATAGNVRVRHRPSSARDVLPANGAIRQRGTASICLAAVAGGVIYAVIRVEPR